MNLKNYTSGTLKEQYKYKSFTPSTINHTFVWDDPKINTMLEDATRALGELNAFTMIVPNVDIFIQMHITKEANTSSKIEGTKTDIDEVIVTKEQIDPEKRDDWEEVRNYIKAINYGIDELERLPIRILDTPAVQYPLLPFITPFENENKSLTKNYIVSRIWSGNKKEAKNEKINIQKKQF